MRRRDGALWIAAVQWHGRPEFRHNNLPAVTLRRRSGASVSGQSDAGSPMRPIREGQALLARFVLLLLLSGCGEADQIAEQQCRSLDARSSVLRTFSDDQNNKLVTFTLKYSSSLEAMMNAAKSETEKSAILDGAKKSAVYSLDGTILVKSKDKATREVTCIAILSVSVLDTSAEKEIEFQVKQTSDGTRLVSVSPFLFTVD
ncbi:hypothetical protein ACVIGA_001907 [Bradyrhizobium sp. USDA 3240]